MNKRYIQVFIKEKKVIRIFPTITKMYMLLGEETIGITKNSLWNALSKREGAYENNKVIIEYKDYNKQVWK